jgi:hypothetical protein
MRVLLDECVSRKLKASLRDYECRTVPEAGFAGKKNGALFDLAESTGFEVFVTVDKGIEYEQNLAGRKIAILVLRATSNQLVDILPLVPLVLRTMWNAKRGAIYRIPDAE